LIFLPFPAFLTKLDAIRQRKNFFNRMGYSFPSFTVFFLSEKLTIGREVYNMAEKKEQKPKNQGTRSETKSAYGDKKLSGPNRPST